MLRRVESCWGGCHRHPSPEPAGFPSGFFLEAVMRYRAKVWFAGVSGWCFTVKKGRVAYTRGQFLADKNVAEKVAAAAVEVLNASLDS